MRKRAGCCDRAQYDELLEDGGEGDMKRAGSGAAPQGQQQQQQRHAEPGSRAQDGALPDLAAGIGPLQSGQLGQHAGSAGEPGSGQQRASPSGSEQHSRPASARSLAVAEPPAMISFEDEGDAGMSAAVSGRSEGGALCMHEGCSLCNSQTPAHVYLATAFFGSIRQISLEMHL